MDVTMARWLSSCRALMGAVLVAGLMGPCWGEQATTVPLRVVVDVNVGEERTVTLSDGRTVVVSLLALRHTVDSLAGAVRSAQAEVLVDGERVVLDVANYHLPVTVGRVQVDCPVVKAYQEKSRHRRWGLAKDARLRFWPKGSPLLRPGTFVYPLKQRIFANDTQMANDPVYVDGGERPGQKAIYYHSGLDFGGSEGREEVFSTVDGTVIVSGTRILPEYRDKIPGRATYDEVMIEDGRGWHHGFFHLNRIEAAIVPGAKVTVGQRIGWLGKEGVSGGWAHLHYTIKCTQPSGLRGEEDAYAYAWEAYGRAGSYSEVLKVSDSAGNVDYDYAVVQVVDSKAPDRLPPTIHAVHYPTMGIKAGDPVTFGVRTFRTASGHEEWDFGDGTEKVIVTSVVPKRAREGTYAETVHRYAQPGDYLVRVSRTDENGLTATAHLHVAVEAD